MKKRKHPASIPYEIGLKERLNNPEFKKAYQKALKRVNRKPKDIKYDTGGNDLYAGIEISKMGGRPIYVGGRYYDESVQIHFNEQEARKLARWLLKAADYLEARKK